jgi:15-cis-phytoene synthase
VTDADRMALVAAARDSIKRGSKSFAAASRLFAPNMRQRVWMLYAWCRACDDLADGQDHGGAMAVVEDAQERLNYIRAQTDAAYRGEVTGDMPFDALGQLLRECPIPKHFADDVIAGFQLDADDWQPRSEDDLFQYCYHVAGAVGCMMAIVMGVDPDDAETLDRACDLGLAFQLGNIARDISEDDSAGRCYLPLEWLVEMDIGPGEHMKPHYRPRLAIIAKWLAEFAEDHAASARVGAASLPFRARWAVLAAAGIYGDIANDVRAAGPSAWDHRIFTSRTDKLLWVAKSAFSAARPARLERDGRTRKGLWPRPGSSSNPHSASHQNL